MSDENRLFFMNQLSDDELEMACEVFRQGDCDGEAEGCEGEPCTHSVWAVVRWANERALKSRNSKSDQPK